MKLKSKERYNFINGVFWAVSFIAIFFLFYISFKFLFFPLLRLLRHIYFNSGGAY